MKQLVLTKWMLNEELQGLLLFVELMDEMIFHFNTHSTKVHATNVRTLVLKQKIDKQSKDGKNQCITQSTSVN